LILTIVGQNPAALLIDCTARISALVSLQTIKLEVLDKQS
jgi:hypothetical protein